jgi:hypothetical protein
MTMDNVRAASPIDQPRVATYVDPADPASTAARTIPPGRTPATVAKFGERSFVLATVVPVHQIAPDAVDRPLVGAGVVF